MNVGVGVVLTLVLADLHAVTTLHDDVDVRLVSLDLEDGNG